MIELIIKPLLQFDLPTRNGKSKKYDDVHMVQKFFQRFLYLYPNKFDFCEEPKLMPIGIRYLEYSIIFSYWHFTRLWDFQTESVNAKSMMGLLHYDSRHWSQSAVRGLVGAGPPCLTCPK